MYRTSTTVVLLSVVAFLCTFATALQLKHEQAWQQHPVAALPRLLASDARAQPDNAAAPAVRAAGADDATPDAETDSRSAAAAREPPASKPADFIGRLRSDTDDAEASPPPPHARPSNKKQASGVGDDYVNQLLVSMKRPPKPPSSPAPAQRRRRPSSKPQPPKPQAPSTPQPAGATPQAPVDAPADDFVCPPGIICVQRGSKLCGNAICGPNEQCIDGFQCCSKDIPLCNGKCCPSGHTCMAGRCSPPGSKSCGDNVCFPGSDCFNTATNAPVGAKNTSTPAAIGVLLCCTSKDLLCGASCCRQGETCLAGQCRATGSSMCGPSMICPPGQQCIANTTCCATGSVLCGGVCCQSAAQCINNRCERPGSSACGPTGLVCPAGKTCITGIQPAAPGMAASTLLTACCAPGQQLCGSACCSVGTTQACVMMGLTPQCVAAASSTCTTGLVCPSNQLCALKPTPHCCLPGESVCNKNCCAVGKSCVSNQCVAGNAQLCGSVICPAGTVCLGTVAQPLCCPVGEVACGGVCCPAARCQNNRCGPVVLPPPPPPPPRLPPPLPPPPAPAPAVRTRG